MEFWKAAFGLAGGLMLSLSGANGQSPSGFFAGKQVRFIVGYPAGSGYDFHARALANHIGRHLPGNPTIVVQNMPGAGSLTAMNYMATQALRDGTVWGAINRSLPLAPLLQTTDKNNIQFSPLKMNWMGSMASAVTIGFVRADAGIASFEDAFDKEILVSAAAVTSDSYMFANMLNNLLKTRLKIVSGYPGSSENFLAVERGEVQGYFGGTLSTLQTTRPDWLKESRINVLIQLALEKDPELKDVPLVTEYAKSERELQALKLLLAPQAFGRPYVLPPEVPSDRVKMLQDAFMATMKDPIFLEEAKRTQIEVAPMSGAAIGEMLAELYRTPDAVVQEARDALKAPTAEAKRAN